MEEQYIQSLRLTLQNVWGSDPISGPISELEVANFLADLHSEGYQTSSLNAY